MNAARARRAICLPLLLIALPALAGAEPEPFAGMPLADALHRLQEAGLRIVFSSDLVLPGMRVESEPDSPWPREILAQILEPHGLDTRRGPRGVLLVVKAPPRGTIRGLVLDAATSRGIAGVEVKIGKGKTPLLTGEDGRFRTDRLPVGSYSVRASHAGYFDTELRQVRVTAGRDTQVQLALASRRGGSDRVVVSASDPAARRVEPAPPEHLDAARLRSRPKSTSDPLRALDLAPGVATHDATARSSVRGGVDDELLVIVDGLELYDPFHLKERRGLVSIIDAETVGSIDFHAGSFPVDYGGRMSGVIDIVSVDPSEEHRTDIAVRTDGLRFGSGGLLASGRGSWSASARRGNANELQKALDTDPSYDPSFYDGFGKLTVRLSDRSELSFHALGATDRLEAEGGRRLSTHDVPGTFASSSSDRYAWVTLRNLWGDRLFSESTFAYGSISQQREGSQGEFARVHDERETSIASIRQAWMFAGARQSVRFGFDYKHLSARYDYRAAVTVAGEIDSTAIETSPSGRDVSVFVSDRIDVRKDVRLELGLRWDRQSYAPGGGSLSPRMNLVWEADARTRLRFAWGLFVQPQRISELQVEDGIASFRPAQRAEHRLVGFDRRLGPGYELRISAYQKLFEDLSPRYENLWNPYGFFPEAQPDRVRIDPAAAEVRGVELGLFSPSGRPLTWWAHYTLAWAEDEIAGEMVPRAWDQRHALVAGFGYELRDRWHFGMTGTWRSGRPTTAIRPVPAAGAEDGGTAFLAGPRNDERLPAVHQLDLRVSRLFQLRSMSFRLSLDVTNVTGSGTDSAVQRITRLPDGGLTAEPAADLQLPRLVTLGFHWSF